MIDTEPGKGTTVTAYLPSVCDEAVPAVVQPDGARTLSGTETILLVEDDPGLRAFMQRTLEQHGYVIPFRNPNRSGDSGVGV